jgi:predicted RecA/RadA family phage recombinase
MGQAIHRNSKEASAVRFLATAVMASGEIFQLADGRAAMVGGLAAIASGDVFDALIDGPVEVTAPTGTTFAVGDPVVWDDSGNTALVNGSTTVIPGDIMLGRTLRAKVSGELTVLVDFNGPAPPLVIHCLTGAVLTAKDNGAMLTNKGAGAAVDVALPVATPGLRFTAQVKAAQGLQLNPNGSETISLPSTGVPAAAGKWIVADAIGESVSIACFEAGTWAVLGYTGTWTAEA